MDYFGQLPLEILDEIAYDELTYRGLLSIPVFARSLTIGRRFDFMVKFGYDFHVKQYDYGWFNEFTKNRKTHRVDKPAIEFACGSKKWYINGQLHRVDEPAEEYYNGTKEWYINGQLHREDGPAEEWYGGIKKWWINGKLHRIDGPAVLYTGGEKYWYIHGIRYTEVDYYLFTANM